MSSGQAALSDGRLEALFAAQAVATPQAPAVIHRGEVVSYDQLAESVERFAADLVELGVGPGVLVALCVARTPDMIALLLAILKAGGAYLPLDPRYPAEHLRFLLADSAAAVLVTDRSSPAWSSFRGTVLEAGAGQLARRAGGAAARATGPPELAYVIYTSGSTGKPKGVMLGHGATHLVAWARQAYSASERACVAATTSLSFDPSVFEIFVPLATGGAVLLKEDALEPFAKDERPTMVDTVPSVLRELCRTGGLPDSVQVLNVGGEALPGELVREAYRRYPQLTIDNHYGPTEATTCATVARVARDVAGDPAIGRPVRGAEIALISPSGAPVADGEAGEILIGGVGLAMGYLDRPELTAERFVERSEGRFYRTGDRAMWRDGELHFAGRLDRQVKVRGFRIEPGEIEAALMREPGVAAALVAPRDGPSGPQLVAYVESQENVAGGELRERLMTTLPGYMVPAHVVVLRAFPRLVSGKIDLAALPAPGQGSAAGGGAASRVERAILHVFEEVLGRTGLGPEDSFFELGGDSLLSVRAALRLEEVLGHELPAGLLHQASSARTLAEALERARLHADTHLSVLATGGEGAPLFCVADLFGQPFNYLSLARELAGERTIYGLAPGPLEAEFAAGGDVERLTAAFASEVRRVAPAGPYLVAGYSAGGLLAACLAGALERDGEAVRLVLLDSALHSRPPSVGRVAAWGLRQALELVGRRGAGFRPLLTSVRRSLGLSRSAPPAWIPRGQLAFARRMILLGARFRPAPFAGATLMVVADARDPLDALFDADGLSGWSGVLAGEITRASAPGGHHQFLREPNVATTAAAIRPFLAAAADRGP